MDKLKQQKCEAVSYKKGNGVLQTQAEVLMEEVAQVQSLLMIGEGDSEDAVQKWLAEASETIKDANDTFEGGSNTVRKRRLCSAFWHPTSSRKTGQILRDIGKLLDDRKGLDLSGLLHCEKLKSREAMLQEVLEAVRDTHIDMIGIYGMIGVGKTILAKELARRAQNDGLFDAIVMIQVSKSVDVKLIQSQIANKIGLQLSDDDDEETRAHFLYNALEARIMETGQDQDMERVQRSKMLVIIDGLQCVIELGRVGIPYRQDERASCKVVLISRSPDVCKNMGAENPFLVESLNLEEAKILFQERLGDKTESMEMNPEVYQSVENAFLIKCRGLPLVIDRLARTLRSMSWSSWEIIVGKLEKHTLAEVDELKKVPYAILELCTNFIQNRESHKLLLLCCHVQQGVHSTTERLKRYGIGFGLFEDPSLTHASQKLDLWIDELKSLSILLASKDSQNIRMHDIFQDVVITALSQGVGIFDVLLDAGSGWYTRESYEKCIAISVMPDGNAKCLNGLECHKLQALWLKDRPSSYLSLPEDYFQGMQNLRILEIRGATFGELPSSIRNLKSLVTLHLECCRMKCISSISSLLRLEVLSLCGSSVEVLPVEIGNLTNLRVLDLTRCSGLFHLGVDVLARLAQLKELYVRGSSGFWTEFKKLNSSLDLEVLEIDIPPGQLSPGDLPYTCLRRSIVCIEDNPSMEETEEFNSFSHVLAFNGNGEVQLEGNELIDLLQRTEMLRIKEASGLRNGVGDLSVHGFPRLNKMHIERCYEMECILDAQKLPTSQRGTFPELQSLTLKGLPKLAKICRSQPTCSSFSKLRAVTLEDLEKLGPHGLPIHLAARLRHLKVINCALLQYIFGASDIDGADEIVKLVCLETLELGGLKKLVCIQKPGDDSITCVLFNGKIEFPSLKYMRLVNLDRVKKLWDDPHGKDPCFRSMKSIIIDGCANLESLFSASIVDSLSQLEELEVIRCHQLTEVITSDAEKDANPSRMKTFPKLQTLKLHTVDGLQYFYQGRFLFQFPALRVLILNSVGRMKAFIRPNGQTECPFFIEEVSFPSLEHLYVAHMYAAVLNGNQDVTTFPNLSSLTLAGPTSIFAIRSEKLRVLCLHQDGIKAPSSIWPINMPPTLAHSLEELTLSTSNVDEQHVDEHSLTAVAELLSSLRKLKLMKLSLNRNIQWNVVRNLCSLILFSLARMPSLISSSLLVGGDVLHHLEYMEVDCCSSMKVIISEELAEDKDFVRYGVTLFPSLKKIKLRSLSSLELFSLGRYEALFPSLKSVEILDCGGLWTFSRGTSRTPRLNNLDFCGKTVQTNTCNDLNVLFKELLSQQKSQSYRHKEKRRNRLFWSIWIERLEIPSIDLPWNQNHPYHEIEPRSTPTFLKEVKGIPTQGGKYILYNVGGNAFEVSSKYKPSVPPLAQSTCGVVCFAKNAETNEEFAIRKISDAFYNKADAKRMLREIKILCHTDHENVVKIKDIIRPLEKEQFRDVYIAYELMDTDLHQLIHSGQELPDKGYQLVLYQTLCGLKYIHSANVLHLNLKPSNLLVNTNGNLKIGGFGLARTISETGSTTEYGVSRWHSAPEVLLNCSEYTAAIDIWSVGCIMMESITKKETLFPGKDDQQQLGLIIELLGSPTDSDLAFLTSDYAKSYVKELPHVPKEPFSRKFKNFTNVSPLALDLAEKMLVFDPSRRITVEEALSHPYLSKLHAMREEPTCSSPFVFDFELSSLTEEGIKDLVWKEALRFNPIR